MKKIFIPIAVLFLLIIGFILTKLNSKDSDLKKIKVADATLTSRIHNNPY